MTARHLALAFAAGATVGLCVAAREWVLRGRLEGKLHAAEESADFWAQKALKCECNVRE
jgi:hypothetical protein